MERLYSILDVKQGRYGSLMTFSTDEAAIRAFQSMLVDNEQGSMLSMYPTDFIMVAVGQFDKDTGVIEPAIHPVHIITGYDAIVRAIDEQNRRLRLQKALKEGTLPDDAGSSVPSVNVELPIPNDDNNDNDSDSINDVS